MGLSIFDSGGLSILGNYWLGATLDTAVAKGTWTASGTWTIPAVTLGGNMVTTGYDLLGGDAATIFDSPYAEAWRIQGDADGVEFQVRNNKAAADGTYSLINFAFNTDAASRNINQIVSVISDVTDTTIDSYLNFKIRSDSNAAANPNIEALKLGCITAGASPTATWGSSVGQVNLTLGGNMTVTGYAFDAGAGSAQVNTTGAIAGLYITNASAGTENAGIVTYANSASPATNDKILTIRAEGKSSTTANIQYAMLDVIIADVTHATRTGSMQWRLINSGSENIAMTLSGAGALWTDASVDTLLYKVSGTQVVGAQGLAVADATDAPSVILRLNDLLARCRAHGLIAT